MFGGEIGAGDEQYDFFILLSPLKKHVSAIKRAVKMHTAINQQYAVLVDVFVFYLVV